jgi:23S rRNA (adenine2503-C2)-methyltransferase
MKIELDLSRRPDAAPAAPPSLAGLSLPALKAEMEAMGVDPRKSGMRAKQLRRWIHHFGTQDFAEMTDVAKELRAQLAERYILNRPEIADHQVSRDGTQKWLTRFGPGIEGESVFIPDVGKAGALCVSSQVGCTLNCTFCHTGTQKLVRNLTAQEIVAQVLIARDELGEWPTSTENRRLTNIVFMGMGEPLYNLDNVAEAIDTISDGTASPSAAAALRCRPQAWRRRFRNSATAPMRRWPSRCTRRMMTCAMRSCRLTASMICRPCSKRSAPIRT